MTNVDADAAPAKRGRGRGRPLTWTPDVDAVIRRMSGAGYSDAEIAKQVDRPIRSICHRRRVLGLYANKRIRQILCRMNLRRMLRPT